MYATCLFCHGDLGRNEAIEHFPVGRRLAFDAAKGRLWVVCVRCGQWNLSPIEERWEAIEDAERLFRDSRKRVSTEQIGLARVGDGTDLVRIGEPQRPEMAAWRYGEEFTRRRWKHAALVGGGAVLAGGVIVGGLAAGVGTFVVYKLGTSGMRMVREGYDRIRTVARFTDESGRERRVSRALVKKAGFAEDKSDVGWALSVMSESADAGLSRAFPYPHGERATTLRGVEAMRVASIILPHLNRAGGDSGDLRLAVDRLESGDDFSAIARRASSARFERGKLRLAHELPPSIRLALEMSLHEDDERRWLEGELYELEQRWQEAEVIAGIADNLTLPAGVDDRIAAARKHPDG